MKTKVAHLGVLVALALILSYVETWIPINFGIPGIKLGLSNLVVIISIYKYGFKKSFFLGITKVLLSNILFGNLSSMFFGLTGMLCSVFLMCILKKTRKFSVIGISMAGAIAHNLGQIFIAMFIVQSFAIIFYLPVLLLSGMITGVLIGIVANEIIKRIR